MSFAQEAAQLVEAGDHAAAEAVLRKAVEQGAPGAAALLAHLALESGRAAEAETLFRAAAAEGDVDAMRGLAMLLFNRRDSGNASVTEAAALLERAVQGMDENHPRRGETEAFLGHVKTML